MLLALLVCAMGRAVFLLIQPPVPRDCWETHTSDTTYGLLEVFVAARRHKVSGKPPPVHSSRVLGSDGVVAGIGYVVCVILYTRLGKEIASAIGIEGGARPDGLLQDRS